MKSNLLKGIVVAGLVVIGTGLCLPAAAQSRGGGGGGGHPGGGGGHFDGGHGGGGWHGGDGWHGGWHGGGPGWWGWGLGLGLGWDAAILADPYLYYPYPWYYYPQNPPVVVAPANPPANNWYYCESARDYYPRVPQCPEPWRVVPAVPPPMPAQ